MVIVAYMFPETANWVTPASEYVPSDTLHFSVLTPQKDNARRHQLRDLIGPYFVEPITITTVNDIQLSILSVLQRTHNSVIVCQILNRVN